MKKIFEIIKKYKTYIIIVFILILSIFSIAIDDKKDKSNLSINGEKIEKSDEKIAVYIVGEVQNPGVYYVDNGTRLNDLIEICGGFTSYANIEDVNLAEKLNDSDKIIIPKKEDVSYTADEIQDIQVKDDLININTASLEELKTLDGIGEGLAQNIINYRKNNKFNSIEEILNVDGIGNAKYQKIKEYICV